MNKKIKKLVILLSIFSFHQLVYADPDSTASSNAPVPANKASVNNDISSLNTQIQAINQEIADKTSKKNQLDSTLKKSQDAINKSQQLLKKLSSQRDADTKQLNSLQIALPQMMEATNQAHDSIKKSMIGVYQQIQLIKTQQSSILSGNSSIDSERRQVYLIKILSVQNKKYKELEQKLSQLQILNTKLSSEVERLTKAIDNQKKAHDQLQDGLSKSRDKSKQIDSQLQQDKQKLSNLKERQKQLNTLLKQLAKQKKKTNKLVNKKVISSEGKPINVANADNDVLDNSSFMSRSLTRPVSGSILVGFGQMRDSVRNNGVLLSAPDHVAVYAISSGKVMFSGDLPGFGQIIVIDNGDNYTSVYSGVIANIAKGAAVTSGQKIAETGTSDNQPMGGVYFELRHLGKPVNPTKIFN